ncbi:hypothetical protein GPX89_34045 [Nocardia sp. ET3-3]|uniref:Uncharacterized protein n=1 Tax=Nocardia terrae TaxID=2675851 RepID=A0A7K1V6M3_9NOCA|nr:hypothetical protein [Nocardia terrae]
MSAAVLTTLVTGIAFAAPAAAAVQQTAAVTGMTSGRVAPSLTALVSLFSVVIGGSTLTRIARGRAGNARRGATAGLVSGLIGLVLGSVLTATAAGGPGTGNGIVASWAAMGLGTIGLILGGLVLNRSRDTVGHE